MEIGLGRYSHDIKRKAEDCILGTVFFSFNLVFKVSCGDGRCTSEDVGPSREMIVKSHICWRGNKIFLIKVRKSLSNRRVLKP